jgi:mono/diheme cytochrome c family protein
LSPRAARLATLLLLAAPAAGARAEISEAEVASYPEEFQATYELMQHRCGQCHTVEHALARKMPVPAWNTKLRLMAKQGKGLNGVEMAEVAQFRAFWVARAPGAD